LIIDSISLADKWETLEIRSLSGKQQLILNIRNQSRISLPVHSLSPGIYVAVFRRYNGAPKNFKFIKQ
jgi:hypothetical protein